MSVVSGDIYSPNFQVENIFTLDDVENSNHWLTPDQSGGAFILNFGCTPTFQAIVLVNTHNAQHRDRSTRHFRFFAPDLWPVIFSIPRLFAGQTEAGAWTQVLDTELADSRQQQDSDPARLQMIMLDNKVTARFVKFELITWWGKSGGLQFFEIFRDTGKNNMTYFIRNGGLIMITIARI